MKKVVLIILASIAIGSVSGCAHTSGDNRHGLSAGIAGWTKPISKSFEVRLIQFDRYQPNAEKWLAGACASINERIGESAKCTYELRKLAANDKSVPPDAHHAIDSSFGTQDELNYATGIIKFNWELNAEGVPYIDGRAPDRALSRFIEPRKGEPYWRLMGYSYADGYERFEYTADRASASYKPSAAERASATYKPPAPVQAPAPVIVAPAPVAAPVADDSAEKQAKAEEIARLKKELEIQKLKQEINNIKNKKQ